MPQESSVRVSSASIPFARPSLGVAEEEAALRVLRSGWLTTGSEALAFENEFAAFLNRGQGALTALAVNSATSGLHLALEAAGVGPGDVVLCPSLTFTSTAEAARYLGADVAFVDVLKNGFLIDPEALEATLRRLSAGRPAYVSGGPSGCPRAVMPVHYGGMVCNMEEIMRIARQYDVRVIEDAAHSFPSFVDGAGYAGGFGDVGVFSFYATKTITTGEGGMVVTRSRDLAARMSSMRSHGIDRPVFARYTDVKASWYYEVAAPGFKYNLPDILAAIGRVQLSRAVSFLEARRAIAARYNAAFSGDGRFILPPAGVSDALSNAWHLYPLRIRPLELGFSRDEAVRHLQSQGIGVSVHFIPLHTMPYYRDRYGLSPALFPETMAAYENEISLPIWPGMTEEMVDRVIGACLKLRIEN
jgi:dTDP-4-amino-4,6-dideoxygalactose transaminase